MQIIIDKDTDPETITDAFRKAIRDNNRDMYLAEAEEASQCCRNSRKLAGYLGILFAFGLCMTWLSSVLPFVSGPVVAVAISGSILFGFIGGAFFGLWSLMEWARAITMRAQSANA